jgi:hypothetical protein
MNLLQRPIRIFFNNPNYATNDLSEKWKAKESKKNISRTAYAKLIVDRKTYYINIAYFRFFKDCSPATTTVILFLSKKSHACATKKYCSPVEFIPFLRGYNPILSHTPFHSVYTLASFS